MQTAASLLAIIQQRGKRGLPLERVYRHLFNRDLYLLAYSRIARNKGAMTPGSTPETVDGMSLAKIDSIIDLLRHERYRWTPVRRVYIEKKHSKAKRPLGLPSWSDKLLQEVIRLILDAYFEPQFSPHAHGFRPQRGCHTALHDIAETWTGTTWFIEGDIRACFDTISHEILLTTLSEHIQDNRFLRLIRSLLKAGYLENWTYHRTLSGAPQGSVLGPILSNIYLDRLDKFVEMTLLPQYNRGKRRQSNPAYNKLNGRAKYLAKIGRRREAAQLRKLRRKFPSIDPHDPTYRRLRYIRYADDILLGFCGPRVEAETIKQQLATFLKTTLRLELSEPKTLITHARSQSARFLGYDIHVIQNNNLFDRHGRRATNGTIGLKVPSDVIQAKCRQYMRHGRPMVRAVCLFDSDFSIVTQYQQEYRGLVEYYRLAYNLAPQLDRLRQVMEQSLTMTLAQKHRTRVPSIYQRYGTVVQTPHGPRKVLTVLVEREHRPPLSATWGGISLARQKHVQVDDAPKRVWNDRTEVLQRLLAQTCELCGATNDIAVHHIRHLKDLKQKGRGTPPAWIQKMATRRRKTLVVCQPCHQQIHAGKQPQGHLQK